MQLTFNGLTAPNLANLDSNFTDLYDLRELVSTPAYAAATPKIYMDSFGNVSLGNFLPGWGAGIRAFQLQGGSINSNNATTLQVGQNLYNDGTNYRLVAAAAAGRYQIVSGVHQWYYAASGTAGSVASLSTVMSIDSAGAVKPGADNSQTSGTASLRWSVVYAGTGTINTSDAREKTSVTPLTPAEISAAKALASEVGTYQWLAAIQSKGADARSHIGMTVQRAMEILTANGLDPLTYGFICHDSWPDQVDQQGAVIQQAGDRYGFRPDELLLFIARGIDARLSALEAKVG